MGRGWASARGGGWVSFGSEKDLLPSRVSTQDLGSCRLQQTEISSKLKKLTCKVLLCQDLETSSHQLPSPTLCKRKDTARAKTRQWAPKTHKVNLMENTLCETLNFWSSKTFWVLIGQALRSRGSLRGQQSLPQQVQIPFCLHTHLARVPTTSLSELRRHLSVTCTIIVGRD